MVVRPIFLSALVMLLTTAAAQGAQSAPALQFPLALECALIAMEHAKKSPQTEAAPTDRSDSNGCARVVQDFARTHCPKSLKTIWEQIEGVADTNSSDDDVALAAACS